MGRSTYCASVRLHAEEVSLHETEPTEKRNNGHRCASFPRSASAVCARRVCLLGIDCSSQHRIHEVPEKGSGQGDLRGPRWHAAPARPSHFHLLEAASAAWES